MASVLVNNNIETLEDETLLNKMLNETSDFDERKRLRARLRDVRDVMRKQNELARIQREQRSQDGVTMRAKQADEDKKKKLEAFAQQAKTPGATRFDFHSGTSDDVKSRFEASKKEQDAKMRAFEDQAKLLTHQASQNQHTQISLTKRHELADKDKEERLEKFSQVASGGTTTTKTTTTTTSKGGGKTTTTTTRTIIKKKTGGDAADGGGSGNLLVAGGATAKGGVQRSASSIKDSLLRWTQANTTEYENVEITNFSTSWNDGMAFCALIHHFYPQSFDFSRLDPKRRRGNFKLAFDTAEKYGDISPLLDVEDMVRMKKPDWKCVFTYVQSIYRHLRAHERVVGGPVS